MAQIQERVIANQLAAKHLSPARRADSERKSNTTQQTPLPRHPTPLLRHPRNHQFWHLSKHMFSSRHTPESAQFCGHRGMEGKALLPELMTLQWWPSTEVPSALRTDTLEAVPRHWGCFPASHTLVCGSRKAASHGIAGSGLVESRAAEQGSLSRSPSAQSRLWNRILYRRSRMCCSSSPGVRRSQSTLLTATSSFSFLFIRDTGPGPSPGWGPRSST